MGSELKTIADGLESCADRIRVAQHKAQRHFAGYITTVGDELERAQRLLADHHAGFGKWVKDQFGWSSSQAHQLINAAATIRLLSATAESKRLPLPSTESQCRPLCGIKEPEIVEAVWVRACECAKEEGKPVTASIVQAARDEVAPKPKTAAKGTPRSAVALHAEREDIEADQMLDEISYYALAFLNSCPERADELEGLLLTWVSRCRQR